MNQTRLSEDVTDKKKNIKTHTHKCVMHDSLQVFEHSVQNNTVPQGSAEKNQNSSFEYMITREWVCQLQ